MTETAKKLRKLSLGCSNLFPGVSRRGEYSDEWYTPPSLVERLGPFYTDPCAGPMKHAQNNLTRADDGLRQPWVGRVWLNPPYSNIEEWLEKFVAHGNGIALVNARPETQWFQTLCVNASAVLWLRGRIRFLNHNQTKGNSTVGSVLVAYGNLNADALYKSGIPGVVMKVWRCVEKEVANA